MNSEREKQFLQLLDDHKNQVYRVCWGFTTNPKDVEDLFQEVILNIWKGLEDFRGDAAASTWIYRVAVNTCILWQKKSPQLTSIDGIAIMDYASENEAFQIESNQKVIELRKAIQRLKKIDRSLILLVLEGFSYQEIAEITGLSMSNVGVKINRIKTKIRTLMSKS